MLKNKKGKLILKKKSATSGVRTSEIDGEYPGDPKVGEPFIFLAKALELDTGYRFIATSSVAKIEASTSTYHRFRTSSGSLYEVYKVEEDPELD